ncbi:ATP-binding protein [Candidatus Dependentiae bacterium]|nr:ATP-binding protein [Candidatus Dependentiae bacterium]
MKEIFKELIASFHATGVPIPSKRDLSLLEVPEGIRKVLVLIGMRRSGKTWSFFQIMHDLMASGIDISKIVYINFEDDRLLDMQVKNFQDILEAYFELYPEYLHRNDIHFFFDEIQEVKGWEKFIRRLLDQEKMELYVSGSSAKMLSKEIASSLRGRTMVYEIFPFGFSEYLNKRNIQASLVQSTKQKIAVLSAFGYFLKFGGFPEVIDASPDVHRAILQGYGESVIYRDIIDRYGVSNTSVLKQLLFHCVRNSATAFSISKMYQTLKSTGYEISRNTLYEYMTYFEDAYCIFSLHKFDLSQRKSSTAMKKVYAVDQGLITAFSLASQFDVAAQLETAVFSYLRRMSSSLFYYRTAEGKEVDFVVLLADFSVKLFQVCVSLKDEHTRRREVSALEKTMNELKLTVGYIITLEEEESVVIDGGMILVVPAWKLFLSSKLP